VVYCDEARALTCSPPEAALTTINNSPFMFHPLVADISADVLGERMYRIEQTEIGFKLTFGGTVTKQDLEPWFEESWKALNLCKKPFGVIVDMRNLELLPPAVQAEIVKGQMLYRDNGLQRSAVILSDPIVTIQFMRLAKKSGIYKYERFIDASSDPEWEKHAEDWVRSGIDPDRC
jgi:hypothetical protein